jgi:SAM-dependent MidA family methyltransferase
MEQRLDQFMARANAAYYASADPLGGFTTAPEISQVFGELLGAWAAVVWKSMGRPRDIVLAELGPGRGTLMADAHRIIRRVAPSLADATHLVENSPTLRACQARLLPHVFWHSRIDTLPSSPLILLANEFLDVLPIRQCVLRGNGWMERYVKDDRFVELPTTAKLPTGGDEGAVFEWSEASQAVVRLIASRVAAHGGAALFIDYGPARSAFGDSLQAVRDGRAVDPLVEPGTADVTAHVDFAALAGVARAAGASVQGPVAQGLFLRSLGLYERSRTIARSLPPARAGAIMEAAQRLAEPHLMGRLFKVMAVCHPSLPPLPGFAACPLPSS